MGSASSDLARSFSRSLLLLCIGVVLTAGVYPLVLWCFGQLAFPFRANGSLLKGSDGTTVGSELIAQPFTKEEYFWPRPSAASFDASASASSTFAASNYLLRDRASRAIGPVVRYASGPSAGDLVGPDVEAWFHADRYQGKPGIVAQWAAMHPGLVDALPKKLEGADIEAIFFDMWRQDHPNADLHRIPGDAVTTSGSGLDPHITLENAEEQLQRVSARWADDTGRDTGQVRREIAALLRKKAFAPLAGLAGERLVNVLEINLSLQDMYGPPP